MAAGRVFQHLYGSISHRCRKLLHWPRSQWRFDFDSTNSSFLTLAILRAKCQAQDPKDQTHLPYSNEVGLSRSSQVVYEEAALIFYKGNAFLFDIWPEEPRFSNTDHAGLSEMRNVSFGFSPHWSSNMQKRMSNINDCVAVDYLERIATLFPSLRKLAIHHIPNKESYGFGQLSSSLGDQRRSVEAFSALQSKLN